MRKVLLAAAALAAILAFSPRAEAAPGGLSGLQAAADRLNTAEDVQLYVWDGRNYCWYWDGWRGPGWYWCGYEWRRGFGWGGPRGWRGWHYHGWRGRHIHRGAPRVMHGARPGARALRGGPGPGRGMRGGPGRRR